MRVPSGLNATLLHRAGVAGQRLRRSVGRWSASHSRTVLSSLPEAMPVPVGAERHARHRVGVAGQRLADRVGRCRRPTPAPCRRRCRRRSGARRG